jgi:hypothetical protein
MVVIKLILICACASLELTHLFGLIQLLNQMLDQHSSQKYFPFAFLRAQLASSPLHPLPDFYPHS